MNENLNEFNHSYTFGDFLEPTYETNEDLSDRSKELLELAAPIAQSSVLVS